MPNSENGIPSVLSEIMKSPEAMGIIDALKERTDEEKKDTEEKMRKAAGG